MEQLTVNQLKYYLGTGLTMYKEGFPQVEMKELKSDKDYSYWKPLLIPLSKLTEDKELFDRLTPYSRNRIGMDGWDCYTNDIPFSDIEKFIENHYWIGDQSYFEKGLIIDKTTLKS